MIEEDAPRPRPADRPTTAERVEEPSGIRDEVTTRRPAATLDNAVTRQRPASSPPRREPTELLPEFGARAPCSSVDGGTAPVAPQIVEEPALLTPSSAGEGVPVAPATRGDTAPVSLIEGGMGRAAVGLADGASWLASCGHERLATFVAGMSKCLDGSTPVAVTGSSALEYVASKLVVALLRTDTPFTGEEIGTLLVQVARDVGVDPCSRTMRKIAKENETVAVKYEALAAQTTGDADRRNELIVRAKERREHARLLRKATR